MSQSKITPGIAITRGLHITEDSHGIYVVCDRGRVCAMSAGYAQTQKEDAAKLIIALQYAAAVPKMIAALQSILLDTGDRESDIETAKAALREAGIEVE
jgi:hypothetical protein